MKSFECKLDGRFKIKAESEDKAIQKLGEMVVQGPLTSSYYKVIKEVEDGD